MVYQNKCDSCGYDNIYHEFSKDLKHSTEAEKELGKLANMIYGEYQDPNSMVKRSMSVVKSNDQEKQPNVTVWKCPRCEILNLFGGDPNCVNASQGKCNVNLEQLEDFPEMADMANDEFEKAVKEWKDPNQVIE